MLGGIESWYARQRCSQAGWAVGALLSSAASTTPQCVVVNPGVDVVRAVGLWHDTLIVPEPGPVSSRAVGPFGAIQLSTTQVAEPRLFLGSRFRLNIRPSGAI